MLSLLVSCFFFFNDPAPTEIYTLSLHDALPISRPRAALTMLRASRVRPYTRVRTTFLSRASPSERSEEHTSELQSHSDLVCRLLLEKKKKRSLHTGVAAGWSVSTSDYKHVMARI